MNTYYLSWSFSSYPHLTTLVSLSITPFFGSILRESLAITVFLITLECFLFEKRVFDIITLLNLMLLTIPYY